MFHGPLIEAAEGLEVATVVTSDAGRAALAAEAHPTAVIASSPEDVWERSGDHDVAVIATTNASHVPLAREALRSRLAVVVDKPLALDSESAQALVDEAAGLKLPLTVFHNRRWDAEQLTLKRLIAEGSLGQVQRQESRFERWRPELKAGAWREETTMAEGGGVLLDLGSHLVDQALALFGEAVDVYGEVDNRRGAAGDDDAFVAIAHRGGVRSHLWASSVAADPGPRLRVLGESAAFIVQGLDGQEEALRSGADSRSASWGEVPAERWGQLVRGGEVEPVQSEAGAWPRFYRMLGDALDGRGPLPVDPADAVAVLRVLERAAG